uniref:3-hydroxyisobutyryl-coenzyme A hydrolase n=1 Tax=Strombidinopsis acuminata TaxID=141414 RepID=A0A7S3XAM2_9SPIT
MYKPAGVDEDLTEVKKPWDEGLLSQMGEHLGAARMCDSVENWTNEEFLMEVRDGIAYCTMNRPTANNAMNDGIGAGLHDSARILRNRPDIRIAVLTGNGRMFCAGGDPKSFQAAQASVGLGALADGQGGQPENPDGNMIVGAAGYMGGEANKQGGNVAAYDFYSWASLPQFTICCMNGSAMGGGVGVISNCDMVVAVRTAHVTLSEVKLGVIPATISPHVIRTMGASNAKRLFVTAENCNMALAKECGLVQRVVDSVADFPAVVKEIAQKVQGLAPGAVAATKACILNTLNQPISNQLHNYVCMEYARTRKGKECEEAMEALKSKSKPKWVESAIAVKE